MSARRITDRQRRWALKAYLDGVPGPVIAKKLGVHRNYAINLARERGWLSPRKIREMDMWRRAERHV